MPLIRPKIVTKTVEVEKVVEVENSHLYEEFLISKNAPGVWVTSEGHHIYGYSNGSFKMNSAIAGKQLITAIYNSKLIHPTFRTDANGSNSYYTFNATQYARDEHYFIFPDEYIFMFNGDGAYLEGCTYYDAKRDDITYTDEYKYYAIMDTDMNCWQILKSKARESVVGTTTGIASSKYGVVNIVEINESVACDENGNLKDELLGATLSAWTGYWTGTTSGTTIYYDTWKA